MEPQRNSQKGLIITIFVLLIIGLGLGVLIAKTKLPGRTASQTNQPPATNVASNPTASGSPAPQTPTEILLNIPDANATTQQKDTFSATVAQYAVETDILDITNCIPDPIVLRIADKSNISVVNKTQKDVKLTVDPQHIFTIPANQQTSVKLDLGHGPGIYGYSCNDGAGVVGIFYLL